MHHAQGHQASALLVDAGVEVRLASADDLDTVVTMRMALLREYGDHPVYGHLHPLADARAPALFARQLASPHDAFLLARADEDTVGLLRCTENQCSPLLLPERYAYISSVYVVPAFRRRGVLRALLAAADAWCAERGVRQMRLHNVPAGVAAAAWTALGFNTVEEVRLRTLERD